jgi:hypothetical protein
LTTPAPLAGPTDPTSSTLQLREIINLVTNQHSEGERATARMIAGDMWQDGRGWIGPTLHESDEAYRSTLETIRKGFVSKNAVLECVERHVTAVVGREPAWAFVPRRALREGEKPTRDEQTLIDEAGAALTAWWDQRKALETLAGASRHAVAGGRGYLRTFVPPAVLAQDDSGQYRVPPGKLAEQLDRIYLHGPHPAQAAVLTDPDTMRDVGIYTSKRGLAEEAELVWVDRNTTFIRVIDEKGARTAQVDFGGHKTIIELKRAALVTAQVRENQALLNLAVTNLARNTVVGGFLERYGINVMPPGKWTEENGQRVYKAHPINVGPGKINFYQAATYVDEAGKVQPMPGGQIGRFDPVPPDTFLKTAESAYHNILDETRQAFVRMTGDATASGVSRVQAVQDFLSSLSSTKATVDAAGRELLETVLAMAATFAGQPGRYASLRANFDCRITAVQATPEERDTNRADVEANLMSRATALARNGIDDPDAELARINTEQEAERAPAKVDPVTGDPDDGDNPG